MSDSPKTSSYTEISLATEDYDMLYEAAALDGSIDEQGTCFGGKWFRTTYLVIFDKGEEE